VGRLKNTLDIGLDIYEARGTTQRRYACVRYSFGFGA
jgi:hypothetical protein